MVQKQILLLLYFHHAKLQILQIVLTIEHIVSKIRYYIHKSNFDINLEAGLGDRAIL